MQHGEPSGCSSMSSRLAGPPTRGHGVGWGERQQIEPGLGFHQVAYTKERVRSGRRATKVTDVRVCEAGGSGGRGHRGRR